MSHPQWREHMEVGKTVLADLGVDMSRVLLVFNEIILTLLGSSAAGAEALEDTRILDIFSPVSETTGVDNANG